MTKPPTGRISKASSFDLKDAKQKQRVFAENADKRLPERTREAVTGKLAHIMGQMDLLFASYNQVQVYTGDEKEPANDVPKFKLFDEEMGDIYSQIKGNWEAFRDSGPNQIAPALNRLKTQLNIILKTETLKMKREGNELFKKNVEKTLSVIEESQELIGSSIRRV